MWSIYILYSEKHKRTYVGCAESVTARLERHNSGAVTSTRSYAPWVIVYTEEIGTYADARRREKYFKSGAGRRKMKAIFAELNINQETCPSG